MSLILTSYNLASGKTESADVTGVKGSWRVTAVTTGCPVRQGTLVELYVKGDNGDFSPMLNESGNAYKFVIVGNGTKSINVNNVNSAVAKVVIMPLDTATGTISIDSVVTDGLTTIDGTLTDGTQITQVADPNGTPLYPAGKPIVDTVEITRPADTTAYTAKDAIGRLAANVAQVETITLAGTAPTKHKWTVALTGTSGTANVTGAGGLTKLATFNTTLDQTAADFVTAHAAAYLAVDITLTASTNTLIFESTNYGEAVVEPVVTNVTTDLAGTAVETVALVVVGEAEITGTGGLTGLVSFDVSTTIDLTATAAMFAGAWEAPYASEGITVTSSGADIIFTAAVAGVSFVAPIITNTQGDLTGTVVHTTANDIADAVEFQNMSITNGGGGYVMDVRIDTNIVAAASKTIRVWLYNEYPNAIAADNAPFVNDYDDKNTLMFYVDVLMDAQEGASDSITGQTSVIKQYKCADTSIFAQVEAVDAFTPTSGGKLNITLNCLSLT